MCVAHANHQTHAMSLKFNLKPGSENVPTLEPQNGSVFLASIFFYALNCYGSVQKFVHSILCANLMLKCEVARLSFAAF